MPTRTKRLSDRLRQAVVAGLLVQEELIRQPGAHRLAIDPMADDHLQVSVMS